MQDNPEHLSPHDKYLNKKSEQADKLQKLKHEQAAKFQICFSTPEGKAVLALLERNYCDGDVFNPDALIMAKQAAERDLIETIKSFIKAAGE